MNYIGLKDGKLTTVTETDHLIKSIKDILTTPVGSRVMRRSYGCNLFSYVGYPITPLIVAKIQTIISDALTTYEKRVKFDKVLIDASSSSIQFGKIALSIEGTWTSSGSKESLEIQV
jgi:phage baseplate assembly protein W